MEKLLYPLWRPADLDGDSFREQLLGELAPALLAHQGTRGVRLAVVDSDVSRAEGLRQEKLCPAADAMISVWLDTAISRDELEVHLAEYCDHYHGFLVTESAPLVHEQLLEQRMAGWTQVVFLERPPTLTEMEWLDVWQGSHTSVAIETQSTFAYRQNVVVRALTEGAPPVHAIVEESFPDAAMDSLHAFYDAASDKELQSRIGTMVESCARFIDFERLNVTPMSDYLLRGL
jgi:hypothetical protein